MSLAEKVSVTTLLQAFLCAALASAEAPITVDEMADIMSAKVLVYPANSESMAEYHGFQLQVVAVDRKRNVTAEIVMIYDNNQSITIIAQNMSDTRRDVNVYVRHGNQTSSSLLSAFGNDFTDLEIIRESRIRTVVPAAPIRVPHMLVLGYRPNQHWEEADGIPLFDEQTNSYWAIKFIDNRNAAH